jgi:hypothetical protein
MKNFRQEKCLRDHDAVTGAMAEMSQRSWTMKASLGAGAFPGSRQSPGSGRR